jgi:hypothetical protein
VPNRSGATAEFKLSITRALGDQLADTLDGLTPTSLDRDALMLEVADRAGVYELFLGSERVYVGKAAKSLRERLLQHWRKLSGRTGIDMYRMAYVCVYVDEDLDSAAPEKLLIKKYRAHGEVPWNTNGFGNKDPGKERDTTVIESNHFDALYPIDLDFEVDLGDNLPRTFEGVPMPALLKRVKRILPYNFRYGTSSTNARQYAGIMVPAPPSAPVSARELFALITEFLPGWQVTALPGYVIAYPESRTYPSALLWWRNENGRVLETAGPREFAQAATIKETEDDEI